MICSYTFCSTFSLDYKPLAYSKLHFKTILRKFVYRLILSPQFLHRQSLPRIYRKTAGDVISSFINLSCSLRNIVLIESGANMNYSLRDPHKGLFQAYVFLRHYMQFFPWSTLNAKCFCSCNPIPTTCTSCCGANDSVSLPCWVIIDNQKMTTPCLFRIEHYRPSALFFVKASYGV